MIDEYNIAMMALIGIESEYERSKDKEDLYQRMKIIKDFCIKYELFDNKTDELCATVLRHVVDKLIEATDLAKYAEERKNNE